MTVQEVIAGTDWSLLKQQKLTLLKLREEHDNRQDTADNLEGLINWIDAIQDAAEEEGHPVEWLTEEGENAAKQTNANS